MTRGVSSADRAAKLVAILKARGCRPLTQHGVHEVRDAVHETVHVFQSNSKTYEREALHEALELAAARSEHEPAGAPTGMRRRQAAQMTQLLRFELQARAVEMLICQEFEIEYDLEHWAFITWLETSKAYGIDIGDTERVKDAILITSRQLETKWLRDRVLRLRGPRARLQETGPQP